MFTSARVQKHRAKQERIRHLSAQSSKRNRQKNKNGPQDIQKYVNIYNRLLYLC